MSLLATSSKHFCKDEHDTNSSRRQEDKKHHEIPSASAGTKTQKESVVTVNHVSITLVIKDVKFKGKKSLLILQGEIFFREMEAKPNSF